MDTADTPHTVSGKRAGDDVLLLIVLFAFVVYKWVFDYVIVLQYQGHACFFLFGREFLAGFLDRPGGLLHYACRFLGQFYHYEWLGALIVATLVTCFGALHRLVQAKVRQPVPLFHVVFPCVLLVVSHGHVIEIALGLLVAGGAYAGYLSLRGGAPRIVYALVVTPALYLVVGGYFWLFAVWVAASAWLDRPLSASLPFKVLYPALAACIPLAAYRWLFLIPLRSALIALPRSTAVRAPYSLPAFVLCGYLLLMPFWLRIPWGARVRSFVASRRGTVLQAALLVLVAAVLLYARYDRETNLVAEYHRLYKARQWDAILEKAKRDPRGRPVACFFTNYALCQKGKLLDEMFNYPQPYGARSLGAGAKQMKLPGPMYNSDLFFEMGHVNLAYRLAFNHMVVLGPTYGDVMRIAECSMVNGNYELAEKHLRILERTLFHRQEARRYMDAVADREAADGRFAEVRKRLPAVELNMHAAPFVPLLTILVSDPQNRMAFDYLTAWRLLDKASLPMVAEEIYRFRQAGYSTIPIHCQEALAELLRSGELAPGTPIPALDPQVRSRVETFAERLAQCSYRKDARRELEGEFGGSYMYYYKVVPMPPVDRRSVYWSLGNEFYAQGRYELAASQYRQVLRWAPGLAEARMKLADTLEHLGRPEDAAAQREEALRVRANSGPVPEGPAGIDQPQLPEWGGL